MRAREFGKEPSGRFPALLPEPGYRELPGASGAIGAAFPDISDLQAYLWEHAWQPIDTWPDANRRILEARGRVEDGGRVRINERPEQFVIVVAGGMGNLHAICLPSWGESLIQSSAAVYK